MSRFPSYGSWHNFVSHASIPELCRLFGEQSQEYKEFMQQVRRGSKRKCKRTNPQCPICPVNWDCATLKAERVALGWQENE